jgi:hypothetical protein
MSTATLTRTRPASGSMPDDSNYKWIAAAVVMVGAIMSILDQTVVNVALPSLERDFHTSLTDIQWVVTGYALGRGDPDQRLAGRPLRHQAGVLGQPDRVHRR